MVNIGILAAILLPVIGGALIPVLPFQKRNHQLIYIECLVILTSGIVWALLLNGTTSAFHVVRFVHNLSISFKIDGMTMVFAGLIATLWPLATLYAFEYMEHEKREKYFFMFFTITYGVTLGIAFASDLLTMYFFYELLTLSTLPLVMHTLTKEAIHASRKYLYYSLGGAAFALIGIIFIIVYGNVYEFVYGGVMTGVDMGNKEWLQLPIYFLSFMGFGVKAAIWPLSSWLPKAGVAPTPVTALLHAVAVVNAGAFGMIRLTYYSFGTEVIKGTWAQYAVMALAMFTILYGCTRAVKESHIKRRLAYSTVSNLSYIIFGITMMSPAGLVGALTHFVFHGFMKICSFLCAGAFMHQTGRKYVFEMDGMGRKMPIVFGCFAVSAVGLMGVPGFAGFISKWKLTEAAVESGLTLAYVGIGCLLISALLTAIYMLNVVIRAFFPKTDMEEKNVGINDIEHIDNSEDISCSKSIICNVTDPTWKMCLPLILCAVMISLFGLFSTPLITFFETVAYGNL